MDGNVKFKKGPPPSLLTESTVISKPPAVAEALFGGGVGELHVNAGALPTAVTVIKTFVCKHNFLYTLVSYSEVL